MSYKMFYSCQHSGCIRIQQFHEAFKDYQLNSLQNNRGPNLDRKKKYITKQKNKFHFCRVAKIISSHSSVKFEEKCRVRNGFSPLVSVSSPKTDRLQ